jgi:cytochrome bd ubiquinol oxidase subunit II
MAYWLPVVWAWIIAIAVLAYILLDGFDLGVGILFAVEHRTQDRDVMVNSVAPVWDGNETWLVLGGGGLMATFPMAYGIIIPALYPTIIGMLLALVFRGVAFEFRFRARSSFAETWWDRAFMLGSGLAAFCQGLTLGGLLQGIHVEDGQYSGGWFDWLTGFTVLCGLALVLGYALQGTCWLILKAEGRLQRSARRNARFLGVGLLALIVIVSLWTPMLHADYMRRWFSFPRIAGTWPVPILVVVVARLFWQGLNRREELTPFLCTQAWIVLCYIGLGISVWPDMVPPSITIWEAAAPPLSQLFLLVGALILLPMILGYTTFSYWAFRGKVRTGEGYQ